MDPENHVTSNANAARFASVSMIAAGIAALCSLASCMQIQANYYLYGGSRISSSPIAQSKPIDAGISTTGDDIGKAINAAVGGFSVNDVRELREQIQQIIQQRRAASGTPSSQ